MKRGAKPKFEWMIAKKNLESALTIGVNLESYD